MKYEIDGKHVKNVPKKFEALGDLSLYITDMTRKRLQKNERDAMEKALVWQTMTKQLSETRIGRLTLQQVSTELPEKAIEVVLRSRKTYHMLRFPSGKELKVSPGLFNAFPDKDRIYRNY